MPPGRGQEKIGKSLPSRPPACLAAAGATAPDLHLCSRFAAMITMASRRRHDLPELPSIHSRPGIQVHQLRLRPSQKGSLRRPGRGRVSAQRQSQLFQALDAAAPGPAGHSGLSVLCAAEQEPCRQCLSIPARNWRSRLTCRKGKTNIVDFYSDYCPPCKKISPLLQKLGRKRPDLAMLQVDINRKGVKGIDWSSPLARQYELSSIPHFQIYDGEGNLLKEGPGSLAGRSRYARRRRHPHVNVRRRRWRCMIRARR